MSFARPSARSMYFSVHNLLTFKPTSSIKISDDTGETWASIGGEPDSVPHDAARARYNGWMPDEIGVPPPALDGAVWGGDGQDYLAFGVDLEKVHDRIGNSVESWVYSFFSHREEYLDPEDLSRLHPELLDKIRRELRLARDLVSFLDRRGGSAANVVNRTYSGEELSFAEGDEALLLELRRARKVMDERLSAINFALVRAEPDVLNYVKLNYGAYLKRWHLMQEMRGLYVDFRKFDPETTTLLDYVQRGVPVYYPLDLDFCPTLTDVETKLVEELKTPEDFAHAFMNAARWPKVCKAEAAPRQRFGVVVEEDSARGLPRPSRNERLDEFVRHAKLILTDALHVDRAPVLLPEAKFTLKIFGEARLLIDPLTELRMMHWAAKYRVDNVREVLEEALLRGWTFYLAYPRSVLDDMARQSNAASIAVVERLNPLLVSIDLDDFNSTREWAKYIRRVSVLFSRPNSYVFLLEGGFFWRLALLLGRGHVARWCASPLGPSPNLVLRRSTSPTIPGYWSDVVSETEKNILLGLCRCKDTAMEYYWFPSPDLLIKHHFHDGEWTHFEEYFLRERFDSLQRGEDRFRPLTLEEWNSELIGYQTGRLLRDSFVPVEGPAANALLADARTEFKGSWNWATLAEITQSLQSEDGAVED
ncbi:hypothetical protein BC629DRAFT_1434467 [Irpex lacteus]|nr:hypothetical protein BC629DRAFT_1434467 [Irpex lacteus]